MSSSCICWNCKFHAKYENTWEGICVNPKSKEFLGYSKNYHNVGLGETKKDFPCFCKGEQVICAEEMADLFEGFVRKAEHLEVFKKYLLDIKGIDGQHLFMEE